MTGITWEKTGQPAQVLPRSKQRSQFLLGGVLMLAAVAYLIISGTASGARYFITIDELVKNPEYIGQTVRVTGAVIGDSIQYDTRNIILDFTVVHIPTETQNLALTLHQAVKNETASRISVNLVGQVKPDLLKHEAQAILTGKLGEDGIFYADELLLKCPSRYEEDAPDQVQAGSSS
jgi:cytochrome c-type biogenesis protein CcmE